MTVRVLLLAMLLTIVTVVIHSLATHMVLTNFAPLLRRQGARSLVQLIALMTFLVIYLLMIHVVEAGVWAFAYYSSQMFSDFSTSAYYSLTCYTTVGFGDVVLPVSSRLLGPIEAAVGVLMFGWSTAVIVAVVQRIFRAVVRTS